MSSQVYRANPLPMALVDTQGSGRQHDKSAVRDVLLTKYLEPQGDGLQLPACPWQSQNPPVRHRVVIDGLQLLHAGPSAVHTTHGQWLDAMAGSVLSYSLRGADIVVLVLDNPDLLPAPRRLLHSKRAAAAAAAAGGGTEPQALPTMLDDSTELRTPGTVRAWLSDPGYKAWLIRQLKERLLRTDQQALAIPVGSLIVVDAGDSRPEGRLRVCYQNTDYYRRMDHITANSSGMQQLGALLAPHNKGEADYSMQLYTQRINMQYGPCNVLISASDTDVWMYALAGQLSVQERAHQRRHLQQVLT